MHHTIRRNLITALTTAGLLAMTTTTAFAANMSDLTLVNYSDEVATKCENSETLAKIPDEIFKYHKLLGGKVTFKPHVTSPEGIVANGLYYTAPSSKANDIEIATASGYNDEMGTIDLYLAHEMGHFIYFNINLSEQDQEVLSNLHQRYHGYDPLATIEEETFAARYASYLYSDYYLSPEDKAMFARCEQQIVDRYNSGFIESLGPGQAAIVNATESNATEGNATSTDAQADISSAPEFKSNVNIS